MNWLNLVEPDKLEQLIQNHREQQKVKGTSGERDFEPVVKLFTPWAGATWLLSECAPDGLAFGLCDLGHGTPELGYVSLDEVAALRGPGGLHVEMDLHFKPNMTISGYAEQAREHQRVRA